MNQPPIYYLIGTDTAVGKTTALCAMVVHLAQEGCAILPFKPAESGTFGDVADSEQLALAAQLPAATLRVFQAWLPRAPGMVDDSDRFICPAKRPVDRTPIDRTRACVAAHLQTKRYTGAILEAAGGLEIPMPGGSWQSQWITELAEAVIVVTHLGLGTINHTLLTLDACRHRHLRVAGLVFCDARPGDPQLAALNKEVLMAHIDVPLLGWLPAHPEPPVFLPALRQLFVP